MSDDLDNTGQPAGDDSSHVDQLGDNPSDVSTTDEPLKPDEQSTTQKTRSKWYWPIRLGLMLFSIVIALAILEVYVQVSQPSDDSSFLGPPPKGLDLPWILIPDAEAVFDGHAVKIEPTDVRISRQGFRADHIYRIPKPEGTKRLIVLGDSFVFGSGVQAEHTFVHQWDTALKDGEVLNMGVPGYTSNHAVTFLEYNGLDLQPDGVVLILSDNDLYKDGVQRGKERQQRSKESALKRYVKGRLQMKKKASSRYQKPPSAVLSSITRAITRLRKLSTEHGFKYKVVLLFTHPLANELKKMGIDVKPLMDADYRKNIKDLQIPGDYHPNIEGHSRLGASMTTRLISWVQSL
jgi:hypothetical protein